MQDKAALKAGIFIIAMVALALGMVVAIAGAGSLFSDTNTYVVEFSPGENIANLKPDAQVRVLGVPVGRVTDVRAVPHEQSGAVVQVTISVPADFAFRGDAEVFAAASLTGDAWLDIDHLGKGEALADGGKLDGQTAGLSEIIDQAKAVVPQAKEALARIDAAAASIEELATAARAKVDPVTESVTSLTERGREAATHLRDILGDTKTDIRTTLANVKDATATAKDRLPTTLDRLDARLDETKELMATAKQSLDRLPAIMEDVQPTIADARGFVANLRGTLADNRAKIDRVMTTATRIADDASGAVNEVRAAPWRLLYKPDAGDQRNLALYSVARQYARGAQDLESAARALQTAAETPEGVDPSQVETLQAELVASYERFDDVQARLWDALRD